MIETMDAMGRTPTGQVEATTLDKWIDILEAPELRKIVRDLLARDESAKRMLTIRAMSVGTAGAEAIQSVAAELVETVSRTLRTRGFIEYRRSFDWAQDAEEMLDELEQHLDSGAAEITLPALKRAAIRLRAVTQHADDSGGVIGSAGQRAVDLYARACREGNPDPTKLARWVVKFRADSPGWPNLRLEDFVAAFSAAAMKAYRKDVAALDIKLAGADHYKRFELDRMLLELADHDGDVDYAVRVLSADDHVKYGAIVDRLRAAERRDEMYDWIDRALAAGRITGHLGTNEFHLDPVQVAEDYLERDRIDDAIAVLRTEVTKRDARGSGADAARDLFTFASRIGRDKSERLWVDGELRRLAREQFGSGATLIELALADSDLEGAWSAANKYGVGHAWESLAVASAKSHPGRAADLRQLRVEKDLQITNSKLYPGIAKALSVIHELRQRAGQEDEFAAFMSDIRSTYGRRPSLMTALDRRRL